MNIEDSVTYLMTQISIAYRNNLQKAMNDIGLHGGQVFVLIALWKNDGQPQIDLARELVLTPPTINKMIGSLERNGFVESRKCSDDGRMMRVFLTAEGTQSKIAVEDQWAKLESESFSYLTETEKLILRQIFEKLKIGLNNDVPPTIELRK